MDNLTHALSGALIARATAPRAVPGETIPLARRVALGAVAASLPDLDFVLNWVSPLTYLENHRGVTHSLLLLPLWSLLGAWLCSLAWRRGPGWRAYFGVFAWGIGIHIVGDWITAFGTLLLAPLSDRRFALSTTFIIDLWLLACLVAGALVALLWRSSRIPAIAALAVAAGYVAFQAVQQQEAIALGRAHALREGLAGATVTAVPRPGSPYNWMVVVDAGERVDYAQLRLVDTPPLLARLGIGFFDRITAPYLPVARARFTRVPRYGEGDDVDVVRAAFDAPALSFFRWFAAYPVHVRLDRTAQMLCVWFEDLRFVTPGRDTPFRYGACRDHADHAGWRAFERVGEDILPVR